ncbi:MAG TPA: methyltransferase domain-containing protein [Terracidiphilus sp.]|nr:methyltransferase domain-containing protein [Terracidiphilus sp.]
MNRLKTLVPSQLRSWLQRRRKAVERGLLRFDRVTDWSVLRRIQPYRPELGGRRGSYIDRFYVDKFLATHQDLIRGHVAEIESNHYTVLYGGDKVERCDVIDINEQNSSRTLTLDLAETSAAPEARFDCILCTQTLNLIPDCAAAIRTLHRMLKAGGTLLATVPGISPQIRGHLVAGAGEDIWRFTSRSAQLAFCPVFGKSNVHVYAFGNVLTATAFLHGLVQEELTTAELEYFDPDYEVLIGIKATRPVAR